LIDAHAKRFLLKPFRLRIACGAGVEGSNGTSLAYKAGVKRSPMNRLVSRLTAGAMFALFGLAVATPAQAVTITTFTDRTAWEAALAGQTIQTEDFNDSVFNDGSVTSNAGSFTGTNWHDVIDTAPSKTTTWTFNSSLTAWGADWDLLQGAMAQHNQGINLFIDAGGSTLIDSFPFLSDDYIGFFGFISDTPFTNVSVFPGTPLQGAEGVNEIYDMDNMSFVAAVPEPGSLILLGLGFGALALLRKGRRED
jgi:hypothetical protein